MYKLIAVLKSRLAMNIMFWLILVFAAFILNFYSGDHQPQYSLYWYNSFRIITTALLVALLYANNLWLLPKFLIRRRYVRYFISISLLAYATGLLYSVLFYFIDRYFPGISVSEVSIFTTIRFVSTSFLIVFLEAFSWMVIFAAIIFLFTMAWYMRDYTRQVRAVEEIQRKQTETELIFLKSQLNPHFLFNTLNNLYSLTIKKSDHAPDIVSKLSNILRYLLYGSNVGEIDFAREKEIMQAYIDLELLRIPKTSKTSFSITADRVYNIPPLLWLPILENLFKHGTRYISNEYHLEYRFAIENDVISIYSKNIHKQAVFDDEQKKGGIGLTNLKKRLSLLYPNKHKITIADSDQYYITEVKINLT